MSKIETAIIRHLIHDEPFLRKVIPFLKDEYFVDRSEQKIVEQVRGFVEEFNCLPTIEALSIRFQNDSTLSEDEYPEIIKVLENIGKLDNTSEEWLLSATEKFCKDKAIYRAIQQSIQIADGRNKEFNTDAIPSILQEALSVCFDSSVGHDYLLDSSDRFDFYNHHEERLPFDLDKLNQITGGGVPRKTLNIIMAGINVGKSLAMCHMAASYMEQGKNVLYITMEMAEERIAERIDANLMNVRLDDLKDLPKAIFEDRITRIRNKTEGSLIIKEYPTASAHAGHFRALLSELSMKKEFVPDVIFIDYINICASARFKMSGNVNSYIYVKGIAEEIRGLAMEHNVPIWSATQFNRTGMQSSDAEMTDTAESMGLPATADLMISLTTDDKLEQLGQYLVKQLKNRYNDKAFHKKFFIGVDKAKMRLYNVEQSAQRDVQQEDKPAVSITSKRFMDKNFDDITT